MLIVSIARLGRTVLYCYPVITVVLCCIPSIKREEMVVEVLLKLIVEVKNDSLRRKISISFTQFGLVRYYRNKYYETLEACITGFTFFANV